MNLDYLAYAILALSFVFLFLPFIGAWDASCHGYLDALAIGSFVAIGISAILLIPAAIVWALIRTFT